MTDAESFEAHLLGEGDWIAATEICRLCRMELHVVVELSDLGVIAPRTAQARDMPGDRESAPEQWQFPATALPRLRTAARLMRDLGVNVSGAALALELLEKQRELERRIRRLERLLHE
jgi:chaperone modulatory protein CbpM